MLSVEEAIKTITEGAAPLGAETVSLTEIMGRMAAEDIAARMTQPPFSASAMDGYAVRFADMDEGASLKVIGEAPAGAPFAGSIGAGEAVRIFTGAAVPDGADHVIIQEDVTREGDAITVNAPQERPRNIRKAGVDFAEGDVLARAGETFHEMHGAILAAANIAQVPVRRRPRVAIFSNGDELKEPGDVLKPGEIINSNHYALCGMARSWGGDAIYLGCASDSEDALRAMYEKAADADIVVPVGGASVGDYDFVKPVFRAMDGEIVFEKVSVRPGKPTWFGRLGASRIVGLPGNPASAIVTAALFVQPLVRLLAGTGEAAPFEKAKTMETLSANGSRESYLRAESSRKSGELVVTPAANQDSSLLSPFAKADVLIRRVPGAPEVAAGGEVEIIRLR